MSPSRLFSCAQTFLLTSMPKSARKYKMSLTASKANNLQTQSQTNIPAIAKGNPILEGLYNLNSRLVNIRNGLVDIHETLIIIQNEFHASNVNMGRMYQNSTFYSPTSKIMPLVHVTTGATIPGFPTTISAIHQLNVDAINDILGALGQPINRTLAEKRIRLAIAIGVNTSVL